MSDVVTVVLAAGAAVLAGVMFLRQRRNLRGEAAGRSVLYFTAPGMGVVVLSVLLVIHLS